MDACAVESESINLDVTATSGYETSILAGSIDDRFAAVMLETTMVHELLKTKVKDFLDELEPFIELLEDSRNAIDENYTRTKKIAVVGSAVSAVGGGLVIAGTAAAPATFGGSLALAAVGGTLVVGGTATSLCIQFKSSRERKAYFEECKERAQEIDKAGNDLRELYEDYIKKCMSLAETVKLLKISNSSFQIDTNTLKHIMMGVQASTCNTKAISSAIIKAAAISPGVINTGHLLSSSARHILCRAVKAAGPSIAVASKVALSFGVALGSIGVAVDIVMGTMALYDIVSNKKCPESRTLTSNIEKARGIVKKVRSYYDLLVKEPEELFNLANRAITDSAHQQEMEELRQENKTQQQKIEGLEQENKELKTAVEGLKQQQLQFQMIKKEQEKQQEIMQQTQQQMQQQMQQMQQQILKMLQQ